MGQQPRDLQLLLGRPVQDVFKGEWRKLVPSPDIELVLELHPVVGGKKRGVKHPPLGGTYRLAAGAGKHLSNQVQSQEGVGGGTLADTATGTL